MSEQHQWKPRVASAQSLEANPSESIAQKRASTDAALGTVRLTALSTLRLSLWRELTTNWILFLLMPMCLVLNLALPASLKWSWALFVMLTLVPLVLGMAAAGRHTPADRFWRGLRGPAWAHVLGRQLLHALLIGAPAVIIAVNLLQYSSEIYRIDIRMLALILANLGVLHLAIYTTISAARTRMSGAQVMLGPLLGAAVVGLSTLSSVLFIQDWSLLVGVLLRTGTLSLTALVATYVWTSRVGVWGAAVRSTGRMTPLLWSGLLALGLVIAELAWFAGPLPPAYMAYAVASDGAQILYKNESRILLSGRIWSWTPEQGYHRLPRRFGENTRPGPAGALLREDGDQLVLEQNGTELSCSASSALEYAVWHPDGKSVVAYTHNNARILIAPTGPTCLAVNALAWHRDVLLYERGGAIHWGDQAVELPQNAEVTPLSWSRDRQFPYSGPARNAYVPSITDGVLSVSGPHALTPRDIPELSAFTGQRYWLDERHVLMFRDFVIVDIEMDRFWNVERLGHGIWEAGFGLTPDGTIILIDKNREVVHVSPFDLY